MKLGSTLMTFPNTILGVAWKSSIHVVEDGLTKAINELPNYKEPAHGFDNWKILLDVADGIGFGALISPRRINEHCDDQMCSSFLIACTKACLNQEEATELFSHIERTFGLCGAKAPTETAAAMSLVIAGTDMNATLCSCCYPSDNGENISLKSLTNAQLEDEKVSVGKMMAVNLSKRARYLCLDLFDPEWLE